jgi:hypothetical protein
VLIFQLIVVVVLLARLAPLMATLPICTPVAAAGVINVGTPAPPLALVFKAPPALPDPLADAVTWLAAMLLPAPSVKAEAPLGTHAQTPTEVRLDFKTQAVWTVVAVLPALDAVLAASVKLTSGPLVILTVIDSGSVALRVTVPTFETAWAAAGVTAIANASASVHNKLSVFIVLFTFAFRRKYFCQHQSTYTGTELQITKVM